MLLVPLVITVKQEFLIALVFMAKRLNGQGKMRGKCAGTLLKFYKNHQS